MRRESKEGVGGTRNPPIPPWPPEAATRWLPPATAAQGSRSESRNAPAECRATTQPFATRRSATPERRAPPPPSPQRSGGVSRGKGESKEGPRRSRAARLECGCRAAARNTGRECAQCGAGNRNPPGPPWPPEAATRWLPPATAAQGCRRESCKTTTERRATYQPFATTAERRVRTHRPAATHPKHKYRA